MSHVPGPWTIIKPIGKCNPDERGDFAICYNENGKQTILAEVIHHRNQQENRNGIYVDALADATLIAAAPELLEACKEAKEYLVPDLVEPGRTVFWNLVEAISKATGEKK